MLGNRATTHDSSGSNDLPIYDSCPPKWLPTLHRSADLGYIGYYPPQPRQEEDALSEANVKNGFNLNHPVSAETFSAHAVINENLNAATDSLTKLEELMKAVLKRRADNIPPIPPSTFRLPSRVTLNDAKRLAWFKDLANPEVPLYKLSKSVPHGAKGHDLLDLLHTHNVEISRAIWFLRVFGANETTGIRNKANYNPTQYSVDWANVVTSYIKKQLGEIVLPSAPRPGLNIKQTFKGVLSDPDSKERWISRHSYCLKLLEPFYSEGLVDHRAFLSWLTQTFVSCNLAQAVFVTKMADEYIDGILECRAFVCPFVNGCLIKLVEIQGSVGAESLSSTEKSLKNFLRRICFSVPEALIVPKMWSSHENLIRRVLMEEVAEGVTFWLSKDAGARTVRAFQAKLQANFQEIQRRNEAMLFQKLPSFGLAKLGSAVMHVQLLNSISSNTNLSSVPFWEGAEPESPTLTSKIDMILTWSVSPLQYGDHRPLAAASLLRIWRRNAVNRATRRRTSSPDEFLQNQLFEWLDTSDVAGDRDNLTSVAILFGKLVEFELFDYSRYVQRLIARTEFRPSSDENTDDYSRHRFFLKCIPLHLSTPALIIQRKMCLYGPRVRESPDDLLERQMRHEIRGLLPEIFYDTTTTEPQPAVISDNSIVVTGPRYAQIRVFRDWLVPYIRKHILMYVSQGLTLLTLPSYCTCVELMSRAKCFHPVIDISLMLLEYVTTTDYLSAILTTFDNHKTIWNCMEETQRITLALYSAHQTWRARGIQSRTLLSLLVEFDAGRFLDTDRRNQLKVDMASLTQALQPHVENHEPVPDALPEILLLSGDLLPDAPSILANSLWFKYRGAPNWAWKVWDNTIASLRQIPAMMQDASARQACALRYAAFLLHVDQHLPAGFDAQVLQWLLGPGKNEMSALSAETWECAISVLLFLSSHGALRTTTILQGLIYPTWMLAAAASSEQAQGLQTCLQSVNILFQNLMLQTEHTIFPITLVETQFLQSRRKEVFQEPHFSHLINCIPVLIFLEKNLALPESLRTQSTDMRLALCTQTDFRCGVYANLDAVRGAFEQQWGKIDAHLRESMILALDTVMSYAGTGGTNHCWRDISCLLSPWKLAATSIKLQFVFSQLSIALADPALRAAANASVDELTSMIFHHSLTSEEAYFVAEMATGVGKVVAGKFVNTGLQCIAELLNETRDVKDFAPFIQRAGEFLRILARIAEPLRGSALTLPSLDPKIQDTFFIALCTRLDSVWEMLSPTKDKIGEQESALSSMITFLLRLLQFDLGFPGVWTAKSKAMHAKMRDTLLQLTIFYAPGRRLDFTKFPLVLDTLCFLIDEFPVDVKAPNLDPFSKYPKYEAESVPTDILPEHLHLLRWLLNYIAPPAFLDDLVLAQEDANGKLVLTSTPVQNRPWEWVEYLGDPASLDPKEEEKGREEKRRLKTRYLVKNNASLPLELFAARMTGDGVLRDSPYCAENPRYLEVARTFEDSLSAEGPFEQAWRESKLPNVDLTSTASHHHGDDGSEASSSHGRRDRQSSATHSLPGSPLSRSPSHHLTSVSAQSFDHTPQPSSLKASSTISDSMDVDIVSNTSVNTRTRASKRKPAGGTIPEEGSPAAQQAKRSRIAAKTRAKKR